MWYFINVQFENCFVGGFISFLIVLDPYMTRDPVEDDSASSGMGVACEGVYFSDYCYVVGGVYVA